jgi:hypothetical protein
VTAPLRAVDLGRLEPAAALAHDEALGRDPNRPPTLLMWRTVRLGGRKVTGIAAHRGRGGTLVHGTLLIDADLEALRACLAGPRAGDLGGAPKPAPSRPDHVVNVGGAGWEAALVEAFAADPGTLEPSETAEAAALREQKYHDPAWHAGPWFDLTPPAVRGVLGATSG